MLIATSRRLSSRISSLYLSSIFLPFFSLDEPTLIHAQFLSITASSYLYGLVPRKKSETFSPQNEMRSSARPCVYVYRLKTQEFRCVAGASVQDSHFLGPLMNEHLLFDAGSYFTPFELSSQILTISRRSKNLRRLSRRPDPIESDVIVQ